MFFSLCLKFHGIERKYVQNKNYALCYIIFKVLEYDNFKFLYILCLENLNPENPTSKVATYHYSLVDNYVNRFSKHAYNFCLLVKKCLWELHFELSFTVMAY